ncbi:hypothetical protein [uncultured Psychroserpens sp.]|uniref:hypothetical protein n=1 Tax=uncultured Psychroserpens sp. TaxID=255436 RepID=UPI00263327AA|nr:hypothetical protein [uncultured Psychroserpens sp.]
MEKSFNLSGRQPLTKVCLDRGLTDFKSVFNYVKQLPYGRTTNRSDYRQVLKELKGTCSTKHALLKAIAIENGIDDIQLYLGVFEMNARNTPKIKTVLKEYKLDYIPEAHCYLKLNGEILDITFNNDYTPSFENTLIYEVAIEPEQIGDYKVDFHKSFLKTWIKNENLRISFNQLWKIREACILAISQ